MQKQTIERIRAIRAWIKELPIAIRYGIGILCILIGIAALITPLTPGAWLAIIGLEFLGINLTLTDSILNWLEKHAEKKDSSVDGSEK